MAKSTKSRLLGPSEFLKSKIPSKSKKPENSKTYSKVLQQERFEESPEPYAQNTLPESSQPNSPNDYSIPHYPSLRNRNEGISSVLNAVEIGPFQTTHLMDEPHEIKREETQEEKENDPIGSDVHFSQEGLCVLFGVVDNFVRGSGILMVVSAIFWNIPQLLKYASCEYSEVVQKISDGESCATNYSTVVAKWIELILVSMLLFALLLEYFPRFEKLIANNTIIDRASPLEHLLKALNVRNEFWRTNIRSMYLVVLLLYAPYFPRLSLYTEVTAFVHLIYFTGIEIYNLVEIFIFKRGRIAISTFYVLETDESQDSEKLKNLNRLELDETTEMYIYALFFPNIIQILIALTVFWIFPQHTSSTILAMGFSLFFALTLGIIFLAIYYEYDRFEVEGILAIAVFVTIFLQHLSAPLKTIPKIIFVAVHIGLFGVSVFCVFKLRVNEEHQETAREIDKKIKLSNYPLIIAGSLIFSVIIVLLFLKQTNFDLGTKQFYEGIVQTTVKWVVDLPAEAKKMFYHYNMSDNEILVQIMIFTYSMPIILFAAFVFYLIIGDRIGKENHADIWKFPLLFGALILSSAINLTLLKNLFDQDWSWPNVAVMEITLLELENLLYTSDLALLGVLCIATVYLIAGYNRNIDTHGEATNHDSNLSGVDAHGEEHDESFMYNLILHSVSTALAIVIFSYFIYRMASASEIWFMTVLTSDFTPPTLNPFESMDAACNADLAQKIITYTTSLKTHIENIQAYDFSTPTIYLLRGNLPIFLMPLASAICLIAVAGANLLTAVFPHYRFVLRTVYIFCLFLVVPSILLSFSLFPLVYFFLEVLVYPFYEVELTDLFEVVFELNLLVIIVPVIALFETYIKFFPVKSSEALIY